MSTLPAAVLAMAVLAAAGALPVLALVGRRWQVVALAPLAGAVVASMAGALCLAVTGSTVMWFVLVACVAALGAAGAMWWRRPVRHRRAASASPTASGTASTGPATTGTATAGPATTGTATATASATAGVVIAGGAAWSLVALRTPSTGFDARAIWLLRAGWFSAGHGPLLAAFRNPALIIAQAGFPPLVSASVAVSWQVTGNHTDRLGVVVVALLGACAVAAAAWSLFEAARVAAARATERRRRLPLLWAGVLGAAVFTLAAFGVAGPFATNGYADPLWSAAAVGAIGFGLLLPAGRANVACASILLAVSGLTKLEGTATAALIVGLIVLRALLGSRGRLGPRRRGAPLRPVLAGMAGVAALAAWPLLTRLEHTTPDTNSDGRLEGTVSSRLHLTYIEMVPHLHVLLLAVPVALVGGAFLSRGRRASGLGNDLWSWAALAAGLGAVAEAYVTGTGATLLSLITSVHRTTMFAAMAAWFIVAGWAVVAAGEIGATAQVAAAAADPSADPAADPSADPAADPTGDQSGDPSADPSTRSGSPWAALATPRRQ